MATEEVLRVEGLRKHFPVGGSLLGRNKALLKAVDGVSFTIPKGETLGLVGESGCGKSTVSRLVLRLMEPTDGKILFNYNEITNLNQHHLRRYRTEMQIVFQDPFSSLNPRMTVGQILEYPLKVLGIGDMQERRLKVRETLQTVGLNPEMTNRYPHEFSGGQRQRIGIARALVVGPSFIVADEPVSALDVSIQAQVLNLLRKLQKELGLTMLFISHNLAVVEYVADKIAVMYLGRIVELADRETIYANPLHPYTRAFFSAIPLPDPERRTEPLLLEGDVPSPVNLPSGCRFRTRCPLAFDRCAVDDPPLVDVGGGHHVACHLAPVGVEPPVPVAVTV